jgi:PadR family transcriptional regulator PadR
MTRRPTKRKTLTAVDVQILLTLANDPLHGYGIKLDVAERTGGDMKLGSGTLYEAMQRLEQQEFVGQTSPPGGGDVDLRRRYYRLERAGARALREELECLSAVVRYGQTLNLLSGGEEA